jgi:hypothetical protein
MTSKYYYANDLFDADSTMDPTKDPAIEPQERKYYILSL